MARSEFEGRAAFSVCLLWAFTAFVAAQQSQGITGKVVDRNGKGIPGAKVFLCGSMGWTPDPEVLATRVSGSDGAFGFQQPDKFGYRFVAATASGYAVGGTDVMSRPVQNLRIVLTAAAPISGKVTDKAGQPVGHAKVRLSTIHEIEAGDHRYYSLPECLGLVTTASKPDGSFWLEGVPRTAQGVWISAELAGADLARTLVQAKPWQREVKIRLVPSATIEGRVLYATGAGAEGRKVSATKTRGEQDGFSWGTAETTADGSFRLTGLGPGEYQVQVGSRKEDMDWVVVASPRVSVTEGGTARNIEIKLVKGHAVTGNVVDAATKKGVGQATVYAWTSDGGMGQGAETDAKGTFTLHLPPGRFMVGVTSVPRGYVRGGFSQELNVSAEGKIPELTIALERSLRISGKVRDPQGALAAGVSIQSERPWEIRGTVSDPKGAFTVDSGWPGQPLTLIALDTRRHLVARAVITPQKGKANRISLRLRRAASAEGKVLDMQGKPIATAQITPMLQTSRSSWNSQGQPTRAGSDGRFALRDLVPGAHYQVSVTAPGYASKSSSSFQARSGRMAHLPLFKLRKADSFLAGMVIDPEGKPIAGVTVNVWSRETSGLGVTDGEGKFGIKDLVKGVVQVNLSHANYETDWNERVATGRRDVRFVLTPRPGAVAPEVAVGKPAPELKIGRWIKGDGVALKELEGKVVLVAFCTAFVPSCERMVARLKALHKQFGEQGLAIVEVHDRSSPPAELEDWVKRLEIPYRVGMVPEATDEGWNAEAFLKFGVQSVPTLFLLDRQGLVRHADLEQGLEDKVAALLSE